MPKIFSLLPADALISLVSLVPPFPPQRPRSQAPAGERRFPSKLCLDTACMRPDSCAKILPPLCRFGRVAAKLSGTLRHKRGTQTAASGTAANSQRHKSEIKRNTTGIKRNVAESKRNIIDLLRHSCRDFFPNRHKKAFHKGASCLKISAKMLCY